MLPILLQLTRGVFINDVSYDWDSDLIYLSDNNNIYRVNPNNNTYSLYLLNAKANGLLYDWHTAVYFTPMTRPQTGSHISSINLNNSVVPPN